jgi:hypothetical protein
VKWWGNFARLMGWIHGREVYNALEQYTSELTTKVAKIGCKRITQIIELGYKHWLRECESQSQLYHAEHSIINLSAKIVPLFGRYSKYANDKSVHEMNECYTQLVMESNHEALTATSGGKAPKAVDNKERKAVNKVESKEKKVDNSRVPTVDGKSLCVSANTDKGCTYKRCNFSHEWKMSQEEVDYAMKRTNTKPAAPSPREKHSK